MVIGEPEDWIIPERVLEFDHVFAFVDKEERMLLYTLPSDTVSSFSPHVGFGAYESIEIDGRKLIDNKENDLGKVVVNHPFTKWSVPTTVIFSPTITQDLNFRVNQAKSGCLKKKACPSLKLKHLRMPIC